MTPPDDVLTRKAALRAELKRLRASLSPEARATASEAVAKRLFSLGAVRDGAIFFVFISHGPEVDTHPIIRRLLAEGRTVTVPRIVERRYMIAQRFDSWKDLQPGTLGILTPPEGPEYAGRIDVVITPGLGFTTTGDRIGFGAGYYDRWFATHEAGMRCGVAFDEQILPALPTTATDYRLDLIVTPTRVLDAEPRKPG